MTTKAYLGDDVYAAFDGYMVTLTTEDGIGRPTNTIYLKPGVLQALRTWTETGFKDHSTGRTYIETARNSG